MNSARLDAPRPQVQEAFTEMLRVDLERARRQHAPEPGKAQNVALLLMGDEIHSKLLELLEMYGPFFRAAIRWTWGDRKIQLNDLVCGRKANGPQEASRVAKTNF